MEGVLPLKEDEKRRLQAVVSGLSQLRDEIVSSWADAYLASPIRETRVNDQQARAMIERLVDLFLDNVKQGRFEDYYRGLSELGHEYASLGISYANLVLAVHLYEEVIDPFVATHCPAHEDFLEAIVDLDHFNHNTLAILASAFFGVLVDQLEDRARQLDEANRRREQFISLVAHEFRGPLTVIIGNGQMLERMEQIPPAARKTADTIVSQAKRLARLVDDLQDVSQIETGHFNVTRARFDLVQLARETVAAQQATTEKHRLVLHAPSQPIIVNWDHDRIAQVLVNLLSNAIKYSPNGGTVTLRIQSHDKNVEFSVSDQGMGIAQEDFSHLFLPYSRLYRRQTVKGTGLGLFITLGIVQAHRGRIDVESQVGRGTTFHLTIPSDPNHS